LQYHKPAISSLPCSKLTPIFFKCIPHNNIQPPYMFKKKNTSTIVCNTINTPLAPLPRSKQMSFMQYHTNLLSMCLEKNNNSSSSCSTINTLPTTKLQLFYHKCTSTFIPCLDTFIKWFACIITQENPPFVQNHTQNLLSLPPHEITNTNSQLTIT
jgi:hypothetical protein